MSSLSRRSFARLVGAGTALAAAPRLFAVPNRDDEIVRLSSNENPYGPPPRALEAMREAFDVAWRYPDEHVDALAEDLAKLHGVSAEQIVLGNGSGEILKLVAAACLSPERKLVVADPTFEAIVRHAGASRAAVMKVPLTKNYSHDLERMGVRAGVVYICNPNNQTASLTPKGKIREFLQRIAPDTVVLVDEAYHHYVESSDYESVMSLAAKYPNLIVARTFSKIYGMAGLRCGYAVAQKELAGRLRVHQAWDSVNVIAAAAARAGLRDSDHVATARKRNSETRAWVVERLSEMGYSTIPSEANFVMTHLQRDVRGVISGLRARGVAVGRVFPTLPEHLRVTIGRRDQMERFVGELRAIAADVAQVR